MRAGQTPADFIEQFERGDISPEAFHHADHVRLAFCYLWHYRSLTALEKFSSALRRFAVAQGKSNRYHETITSAYFYLIGERMSRNQSVGWEDFADKNSDLLTWEDGILTRYYEPSTLQSELARRIFILPDRGLRNSG